MSCLFDSLEKLLREDLVMLAISSLRDEICDYMKMNISELLGDETIKEWLTLCNIDENKTPEEYIELMRKSNEWGGAPELAIVSKMVNVIINVEMDGKIISTFNCAENKPTKEITLNYTGNHYTPSKIVHYFCL